MKSDLSNIKIDAVITWVNGNDKIWQEKINAHSDKKLDFSKKKNKARYNSIGEIDIAIQSIIKFASFVSNIFLVTDNQQPDSFLSLQKLAKDKGINLLLIDHKVIFKGFENYLPTFNSCSIGCMLFKIPNLSEHFIIFNDDTFLMRDTKPNDFFINGYPIIRGKEDLFREDRKLRSIYRKFLALTNRPVKEKTCSFKQFQQTSAKLAFGGKRDSYIRRYHTPVCLRKSTLENFFAHNNLLENNIKHRFRHKTQFIISSLSEHLEIKQKTFYYRSNTQLTYFRSYKYPILVKLKLYLFLKKKHSLFVTFQSLDMADKNTLSYILNWIEMRLSPNT
jgi:hypothetical protein